MELCLDNDFFRIIDTNHCQINLRGKSSNHKTKIMKTIKLILFSVFIHSAFLYGQEEMIYPQKIVDESVRTNVTNTLQRNPVNNSIEFIEINRNKLTGSTPVLIKFKDKNFKVIPEKLDIRDVNNFSWFGRNVDNDGNVILSILNGDVQGIITKGNEIYRISTIASNEYVIASIDQSQYPKEKCDELTDLTRGTTISPIDQDPSVLPSTVENAQLMLKSVPTYECKIRVLVMHTPAAEASVSNIRNTIQLAVDETNQSFVNSDMDYEIELVYVEETNYTEVDIETDLSRFSTDNDGYMDEVHDLRETYDADVCVLIMDDANWCGLARTVGASDNEAFCAVDYDCATGYYSFGHEIGHLLGCRHDTYVDNSSTPFTYGHGFVNTSDRWRTIMAYNTKCSDNGFNCTRLQFWSNPGITFGGDPMGTQSTEDCARVWDEEAITIMNFRQPDNIVTLTNNDISNSLYADVIAKQTIMTSGNLTVLNGSRLSLRAGNNINLQSGFIAQSGSELLATLETVSDCGSTTKSTSLVKEGNITVDNSFSAFSYNIYPNPSSNIINIDYTLEIEKTISIDLIDFLGRTVSSILSKNNQPAGNYRIQFDVSSMSSGVYFINFRTSDEIRNEKIIINN